MRSRLLCLLTTLLACEEPAYVGQPVPATAPSPLGEVASETQRTGDAERGRQTLATLGYVGCGIPWRIFSVTDALQDHGAPLPGRTGLNRDLPFFYTAFRTQRGVDVVSANC